VTEDQRDDGLLALGKTVEQDWGEPDTALQVLKFVAAHD